jgi:hypothetical protein
MRGRGHTKPPSLLPLLQREKPLCEPGFDAQALVLVLILLITTPTSILSIPTNRPQFHSNLTNTNRQTRPFNKKKRPHLLKQIIRLSNRLLFLPPHAGYPHAWPVDPGSGPARRAILHTPNVRHPNAGRRKNRPICNDVFPARVRPAVRSRSSWKKGPWVIT